MGRRHVYVEGIGGLHALHPATGTERWRFERENVGLPLCSNFYGEWNGVVYIACDDGNLYALSAASGAELTRFRFMSADDARTDQPSSNFSIQFAANQVFVTTSKVLYALRR